MAAQRHLNNPPSLLWYFVLLYLLREREQQSSFPASRLCNRVVLQYVHTRGKEIDRMTRSCPVLALMVGGCTHIAWGDGDAAIGGIVSTKKGLARRRRRRRVRMASSTTAINAGRRKSLWGDRGHWILVANSKGRGGVNAAAYPESDIAS